MIYKHSGNVIKILIQALVALVIFAYFVLMLFVFIELDKTKQGIFIFSFFNVIFLVAMALTWHLTRQYLLNAKKIIVLEDYLEINDCRVDWRNVSSISQLENVYFVSLIYYNESSVEKEEVVFPNKFERNELFPFIRKENTKFVKKLIKQKEDHV